MRARFVKYGAAQKLLYKIALQPTVTLILNTNVYMLID
jgi:hypothetical protein